MLKLLFSNQGFDVTSEKGKKLEENHFCFVDKKQKGYIPPYLLSCIADVYVKDLGNFAEEGEKRCAVWFAFFLIYLVESKIYEFKIGGYTIQIPDDVKENIKRMELPFPASSSMFHANQQIVNQDSLDNYFKKNDNNYGVLINGKCTSSFADIILPLNPTVVIQVKSYENDEKINIKAESDWKGCVHAYMSNVEVKTVEVDSVGNSLKNVEKIDLSTGNIVVEDESFIPALRRVLSHSKIPHIKSKKSM